MMGRYSTARAPLLLVPVLGCLLLAGLPLFLQGRTFDLTLEEGPKRSRRAARAQQERPQCLCLERIVAGLANPLLALHGGHSPDTLYLGEQRGVVRVLDLSRRRLLPEPFVDLTAKVRITVSAGDERGLNGLAFHPAFATNGRLFVYYNAPPSGPPNDPALGFTVAHVSRLSELRLLPSNWKQVDPHWERVLLEVPQPFRNHNGGQLLFGDDGYLYLFLGDGGSAGDPLNLAQNMSSLLGKVLRLDVDTPSQDSSRNYTIPPDNPFLSQAPAVRPEIFAFGLRNPWRCGLDPGDRTTGARRGLVMCGDVGQGLYEELDLLQKGANYGWPAREGWQCYKAALCGHIGVEQFPVHVYNHTVGISVIGGKFYRGCRSPSLNGLYLYGDYLGRLFMLRQITNDRWENSDVILCADDVCTEGLTNLLEKFILSFGQDQQGEVYVLTSNSSKSDTADGALYRIVDSTSTKTDQDCPMPSAEQ